MTARAQQRQTLMDLLVPVVQGQAGDSYDLEDVTVTNLGSRSLIRVVVDADHGIDLDAVAEISHAVSATLDSHADVGFTGPYVLEVSSPGIDRPLTEGRHWRRAVGRLVEVKVSGLSVTGRVMATTDDTVTLDVNSDIRAYEFAELGAGRVQVEFSRPSAQFEDDADDADDAVSDGSDDSDDSDEGTV